MENMTDTQQLLSYIPSFLPQPTSNCRGPEGQTDKEPGCCNPILPKGPEGELMVDVCMYVCIGWRVEGNSQERFFHPDKDIEDFKK